jgi:hypothetical protein
MDIFGSDGVKLAGHRTHMTNILLHINDFLDYLICIMTCKFFI